MGYKLMLFPLTNLSAVVFRSLFPVLSRKQNDVSSFGALYLRATGTIALFTAPLMAGVWVLRKPFVEVFFGDKWLPVADVLGWLAPVGCMQSILSTVGLIYLSVGQTRTMMRWGFFASAMTLLGFVIGLQWGYLGVARSYAVVNLLLFYPGFAIHLRLLGLSFADLLKSIAPQLLAATMMAALVGAIDQLFTSGESSVFRLSVLTASGVCFYLAAAYLFMRSNLQALLGTMQGLTR
jgi:O-antigen/teichoic acid export membrane protein